MSCSIYCSVSNSDMYRNCSSEAAPSVFIFEVMCNKKKTFLCNSPEDIWNTFCVCKTNVSSFINSYPNHTVRESKVLGLVILTCRSPTRNPETVLNKIMTKCLLNYLLGQKFISTTPIIHHLVILQTTYYAAKLWFHFSFSFMF